MNRYQNTQLALHVYCADAFGLRGLHRTQELMHTPEAYEASHTAQARLHQTSAPLVNLLMLDACFTLSMKQRKK